MAIMRIFLAFALMFAAGVREARAGEALPVNAYQGRQERVESFAFAQKPSLKKEGDKWIIAFATTAACDATIAVVDPEGKIVRHLASGVLGANAPWPYTQNSLSQKIEWDGNDDRGKPVPPRCKVRVGLGLKAALDKIMGDEPLIHVGTASMASDAQGHVYSIGSGNGNSNISVMDRDGKYVRMVWPPPANTPPDKLGSVSFVKRLDGKLVPSTDNACTGSYFRGPGGVGLFGNLGQHTPVVTPDGKELLFIMGTLGNDTRQLVRLNTDGSLPAGNVVTIDPDRYAERGEMFLAVSPDGTWVYFCGGFDVKKKNSAVYRRKLADLKSPAGKVDQVIPESFVGEPNSAGSDEKHLKSPRGVACDSEGNVYVADYGNDRIQVFGANATFLKSLPIPRPYQVAVNPKSGEVYTLTCQPNAPVTLVKLGGIKDPSIRASIPLAKAKDYPPCIFKLCLDASANAVGLWVLVTGRGIEDKAAAGFWRIEDRGAAFEKVRNLSKDVEAPWNDWAFSMPTGKGYIIADPNREEIYVKDPAGCFPVNFMRLDGRTGKLIEHIKGSPGPCEELAMGPDGLIYVRADGFGKYIVRFDPTTRTCVPFAKGVEYTWCGQKTTAIRVAGSSDRNSGVRTFQNGFDVATNGDIYLILTEADSKFVDEVHKLGQGEKLSTANSVTAMFLQIYSPDGTLKHASALPGLINSNGMRVARNGDVYVSLAARKADLKEPDGIVPGESCDFRWGTVMRFASAFDKFPIGRIHGTWDTPLPATGPAYMLNGSSFKPTPDTIRWDYHGQSPSLSQGGNCSCYNSCLDLDGFERAWVPMSQNFSVNTLDANGNVMLRIGTYGNQDSRGKNSPVVDPKTGQLRPRQNNDPADLQPPKELANEIGWLAPRFVAASDEALYVNDTGNQRIVRCALGYAVEETVPMP